MKEPKVTQEIGTGNFILATKELEITQDIGTGNFLLALDYAPTDSQIEEIKEAYEVQFRNELEKAFSDKKISLEIEWENVSGEYGNILIAGDYDEEETEYIRAEIRRLSDKVYTEMEWPDEEDEIPF